MGAIFRGDARRHPSSGSLGGVPFSFSRFGAALKGSQKESRTILGGPIQKKIPGAVQTRCSPLVHIPRRLAKRSPEFTVKAAKINPRREGSKVLTSNSDVFLSTCPRLLGLSEENTRKSLPSGFWVKVPHVWTPAKNMCSPDECSLPAASINKLSCCSAYTNGVPQSSQRVT